MRLFENWTATVDAFAKYDNLLSFSVGNEVINTDGKLKVPNRPISTISRHGADYE